MIPRRSFLAGTAALAVIPVLPVEAGEIWYYRGVPVTVDRLPDRVEMTFEVGGWGKCGVARLVGGRVTDETLARACRHTVDFQINRKPLLWGKSFTLV